MCAWGCVSAWDAGVVFLSAPCGSHPVASPPNHPRLQARVPQQWADSGSARFTPSRAEVLVCCKGGDGHLKVRRKKLAAARAASWDAARSLTCTVTRAVPWRSLRLLRTTYLDLSYTMLSTHKPKPAAAHGAAIAAVGGRHLCGDDAAHHAQPHGAVRVRTGARHGRMRTFRARGERGLQRAGPVPEQAAVSRAAPSLTEQCAFAQVRAPRAPARAAACAARPPAPCIERVGAPTARRPRTPCPDLWQPPRSRAASSG